MNRIFSQKNIPKLIILTPILTIILIAFFTIYFFITTQYNYFEEESIRIEKEYIKKQKEILQKEINYVLNYIKSHKTNNKTLKEKELKEQIIRYIETIRYKLNGYIWIHDTTYHLIAHPFRQDKIGTLDKNLKDAKGTYITKQFINKTLQNPEGIFIEYYWTKPKETHPSKKLGFFKLYDEYNWVIGTGLYIDDIKKSILANKNLLEQRIDKYIRVVVFVSLCVMLFIGILSFIISKKISKVFHSYQKDVKEKEFLKDRAMLHQARLARMGVMLSLISHQWRQPLCEVSSILMELETASKFKKADNEMIMQSVKESNKLLDFMSNTIDDFKDFFKPDKEKVDFSIANACDEAISLSSASIKNLNIKLTKTVKSDSIVNGYEREFAQVILNIILNAKDTIEQRNIKQPTIDIIINKIHNHSIITIEDNAKGINKEHLDLIFEPYFTTKSSLKGTGLGLYMSKMIIEKNMNGELSVQNQKNGAIFTIKIKNG